MNGKSAPDRGDRDSDRDRDASGFWRRLFALTKKEIRQLLRDRSNLALGIGLPAVLILVFGYGISLDVRDAPVAVVLEDSSPLARDAISGIALSPYLAPLLVGSMHDAEAALSERTVDGIVRIPSDFAARFSAGDAVVQFIVNGGDAATARAVEAYVGGAFGQWAARQADRARTSGVHSAAVPGGTVTVEPRLWFNAANTSTWYLVPGLIVLIMTLLGAFLTSLVVAREWERGTLEALFVTPVRPTEILLAKLVPYFAVGMLGFAMCLLAARFLFDVPLHGSLLLLVAASVLYLIVALGTGLLISSAIKNQFLASQIALLTSFLPALMLSGFLFDLRNVPWPVRVVGDALPATHFLELIKTLFLAGNVWIVIAKDSTILVAYAIVFFGAARLVTKKRIA